MRAQINSGNFDVNGITHGASELSGSLNTHGVVNKVGDGGNPLANLLQLAG